MFNYKLQQFAEAVQGKRLVYLYRILPDAATASGTQIAFTTENERTKSKDADSVATKDGSIRVPGTAETEITASSVLMKDDTLIDELEEAMDNDELIEVWEVNLEEEESEDSGTFKAKYFQGYITELSITSSAEDMVEVALTFGINGDGVSGYATVTDEQQEMAAYVFTDTQPTGA